MTQNIISTTKFHRAQAPPIYLFMSEQVKERRGVLEEDERGWKFEERNGAIIVSGELSLE